MASILRRRHRAAPDVGQGFELTPAQVAYFETFGFLLLPGLFADDVDRIRDGFEEVFVREKGEVLDPNNEFHRTSDPRYQQETRWIVPAFIDRSEKLAWIRDDDRLGAIARALLGEGYEYAESDGNLFNCDVYWHMDAYGATADRLHIKAFFYLDALRHDAGALRVIPGSHHNGPYTGSLYRQLIKEPERVPEVLGVARDEVPSVTLEVEPGDMIVTNFRTIHGSFNGGVRRRLFTVNYREASAAGS